jgi:cytochrome P450
MQATDSAREPFAIDTRASLDDSLHPLLREAAAAGPIAIDAVTGGVYVLRYHDVEQLAHEPRLAGIGLALFDLMGIADGPLRDWYGGLMFTNEGEAHHRLRALVSRAFTPKAVDGLRPEVARLAADALARVHAAGGGDLVGALRLVPMHVMCRLLGVPVEDVAVFGAWADALSPVFGILEPEQIVAAEQAITELLGYVDELTRRRASDPGDDLVTALLAAEVDGGRLTHDEVLAMVANLLVGGHDTTSSQLGCSCLTLLRHPDEMARVGHDRALLGSAVAETIRFEPSLPIVPRTVAEPLTVLDLELPSGNLVMLVTAAANREAGVWRDPDRLDVGRFTTRDAPRLLSFGAGPHYCLGTALARLTVEESVGALLDLGPIVPTADPWAVEWRVVLGRSPARLDVAVV